MRTHFQLASLSTHPACRIWWCACHPETGWELVHSVSGFRTSSHKPTPPNRHPKRSTTLNALQICLLSYRNSMMNGNLIGFRFVLREVNLPLIVFSRSPLVYSFTERYPRCQSISIRNKKKFAHVSSHSTTN